MADRLTIPYKTPLQRSIETILVLIFAFGLAALWHQVFPGISPSYIIVAGLIGGFAAIPRLGRIWAERHGAPMLSAAEGHRRYLSELGPIGTREPRFWQAAIVPQTIQSRRQAFRGASGRHMRG